MEERTYEYPVWGVEHEPQHYMVPAVLAFAQVMGNLTSVVDHGGGGKGSQVYRVTISGSDADKVGNYLEQQFGAVQGKATARVDYPAHPAWDYLRQQHAESVAREAKWHERIEKRKRNPLIALWDKVHEWRP